MSIQDLAASLELEAFLNSKDERGGIPFFNTTKELFSAPIPGAGIKVPHIFKLGAIAQFRVGIGTAIYTSGNLTFGLAAALVNPAMITLDMLNPERSSQKGFDVDLDPTFNIHALSGKFAIQASARPKLTFGVEIVKAGRLEAYAEVKVPQVSIDLGAAYGE